METMEKIQGIIEGLYDSLFSFLPSDLTIFLISILGIIIVLAIWRVVLGG